ncbi:hypothetical protein F7725_012014 [Dissostichus mawsoni]|uniref:Uncharacterized protein n=1 Tax=Dissostichus mawsoni TaxID=36200 RepID=A0A7J5ZB78_DISMA|nr:hypothetical protein F7725_012014 [Dissostichus mawsoni]
MDEMGRILEAGNKNFTDQIKARWESFCENALFFGVLNKSLKPPMGLDKCKHNANIDNTDRKCRGYYRFTPTAAPPTIQPNFQFADPITAETAHHQSSHPGNDPRGSTHPDGVFLPSTSPTPNVLLLSYPSSRLRY